MKKRLLAVLLTLAIVLGMIVVPAYATEEETEIPAGYCQHCKSVIPENEWLAWDETDTVPRTGHYYLTRDVAGQTNQIIINLDDDLLRNTVCLDLRGKTYTVSGVRAFLIYGVFSVMDTVGGGEFAVTGATGAHGAFAMLGKDRKSVV